LYDPQGINKEELSNLIHKKDIDSFSPNKLHEGAFLLYANERKRDGLIDRFKKVIKDKRVSMKTGFHLMTSTQSLKTLYFLIIRMSLYPAEGVPKLSMMITGKNFSLKITTQQQRQL